MGRKKTTEQFIKEMKIVNSEITVIGEYVTALTKIEVKHTCGYEWWVTPTSLLQGTSCPKCANFIKTKTTEQFVKELKIINPEITVIGKYINSQTKIKIQHTCGNKWESAPNNLLKGKSCPKCSKIKTSKKQTETTEQFIEKLKIVNPEITVIGKYINSQTKIEVQHTCGYKWNTTPTSLLQGSSCPKCFGTLKKTTKQFIEELKIINPEITVIGEYINSRTKIEVQHSCGHKWKVTPNGLLQGTSCTKCARLVKKTKFIKEIGLINPELTVIGEYVNTQTKTKVQHSCGYEWKARPSDLLKGKSCPRCKESKGEKFLSKVLTSNNISFVSQFNLVKNPKTNYWLKSDFAILNKDSEPILILEYDGEQHFKPVEIFGGEKSLKATQYRDYVKNEYCKENNIPFLRFNYKQSENDITDLLLKQLKKMKLI